jgi:hypothetical protein
MNRNSRALKCFFSLLIFIVLTIFSTECNALSLNKSEMQRRMKIFYPISDMGAQIKPVIQSVKKEDYEEALGEAKKLLKTNKNSLKYNYCLQAVSSYSLAGSDISKAKDLPSPLLTFLSWIELTNKNYDRALQLTQQCVEKYQDEALSQQKTLNAFPHSAEARYYWALNDVGTCLFIMGESYYQLKSYQESYNTYQKLACNFSFAQCYDPDKGYWKPSKVIESKITKLLTSGKVSDLLCKENKAESATQTKPEVAAEEKVTEEASRETPRTEEQPVKEEAAVSSTSATEEPTSSSVITIPETAKEPPAEIKETEEAKEETLKEETAEETASTAPSASGFEHLLIDSTTQPEQEETETSSTEEPETVAVPEEKTAEQPSEKPVESTPVIAESSPEIREEAPVAQEETKQEPQETKAEEQVKETTSPEPASESPVSEKAEEETSEQKNTEATSTEATSKDKPKVIDLQQGNKSLTEVLVFVKKGLTLKWTGLLNKNGKYEAILIREGQGSETREFSNIEEFYKYASELGFTDR